MSDRLLRWTWHVGGRSAFSLLLLAAAAMPRTTLGAEDDTSVPGSRLALLIGVHDWSGLGDLQSADGGSFHSTGSTLAAVGHRRVAEFQRNTLLVGGEVGFFTNDSNIQGLTTDLSANGMYIMPSLKLAFGRQRNFYVDAGAGVYFVDFTETGCGDFGCGEIQEIWQETKFAGYLGISADLRISEQWAVALEAKVHFVNFGTASGLGAEPQSLDGPIYLFQVGAAF